MSVIYGMLFTKYTLLRMKKLGQVCSHAADCILQTNYHR